MTTPLKRIERFSRILGVSDTDIRSVIIPFATSLLELSARRILSEPENLFRSYISQSWWREIDDVNFGVQGFPDFEGYREQEIEDAVSQRKEKARLLLTYIAGVIGV